MQGKQGTLTLLKPHPSKCEECAAEHRAEEPHNASGIYYQVFFQMQHGRSPTWTDAMSQCSDEMKSLWISGLARFGVTVTPDGDSYDKNKLAQAVAEIKKEQA
jgi:hypothetical protein